MNRIEDCISFLIGKAAQQVSRRARDLLAPHGVTPVQYAVLKVLAEADGLSGAEVGARLVLDSASITGVADRLEALGLVQRRPHPDDRRVHRLFVTGTAKSLQAALDAAMDALNAEAAEALEGDRDRVLAALRSIGQRDAWARHV